MDRGIYKRELKSQLENSHLNKIENSIMPVYQSVKFCKSSFNSGPSLYTKSKVSFIKEAKKNKNKNQNKDFILLN